ncbi:ribosomal protein S36 [Basidiobolus ranarum]|uniref:Ribosomal protein S36 n=1 Tax=Basidiobolus ranarum TaxID=34480 RepID=A0ABR2X0P1_9FUNG
MQPTLARFAIRIPKKHVPLIKFLGPRKRLATQTEQTQTSTSATLNSSATKSEKSYVEYNELPTRFRRVPITQEEIEAIEMGGAGYTL